MSSEASAAPPASSAARSDDGRQGPFRQRLIGTVLVLVVAVAGFGFAGLVQGPRLDTAELDVASATRLAGERLTLTLNQPVVEIDAAAIEVEPATSVTATVDDRDIVITFDRPLDYAAEYTVRVPGVVGAYQAAPAVVEHRFATPDEDVYVLHRRSHRGEADLVQRSSFADPRPEVVFSAPRIQEFARAGAVLVVVTVDDEGRNGIALSKDAQPDPAELALPQGATIRDLAASTTHPLVGFVLDTPAVEGVRQHAAELMTLDLSGTAPAAPLPVLALDGTPMRVMSWAFVPGTTSLVAQDFEQGLYLVDALGGESPTPLGVHAEIRGFIAGTSELLVADPDGGSVLGLADGTATALELQTPELADNVYADHISVLDGEGRYLVSLVQARVEAGRNVRSSMLAAVGADGELSKLFAPAVPTSVIRDHCTSPNGRWVAVAESPDDSRPDGYSGDPGFTERMTTIVEISTGRVALSLQGGFSDWCAP
ncbi:hypothetical protein [Agromyces sp. H66]|uniref:hypothetical protein n=1 Tax=Agromyces sp. H66 TaxID=2529859 RepID=UPI0010AA7724|nr:hypothetical protein [Agromyces sp. H66]